MEAGCALVEKGSGAGAFRGGDTGAMVGFVLSKKNEGSCAEGRREWDESEMLAEKLAE